MKRLTGKIRRAATSLLLPVDENRIGECKRCGSCCKFLYQCPFLRFEGQDFNKAVCIIRDFRPPMCKKYPRTRSEQIHRPCGYDFY